MADNIIEDSIMDNWVEEDSIKVIGAEDPMLGLISGPFRTAKSARWFYNLWGALKKWRGYKLPTGLSESQAKIVIQKTSDATGVPKGKLSKFAKEKVSGTRKSIAENRKISLSHGEKFRKARGQDTKLFGGWKGGTKYKDIKNSIGDKDMSRFFNEAISESTKRY